MPASLQGAPFNRQSLLLPLAVLAGLCILSYAPSLRLPLLEDDYPNLWLAQLRGPLRNVPALLSDPVLRPRATSEWTLYALWELFGTHAAGYRVFSLSLHLANTWLLYALLLAWPRMRPAAFWAAAFFAIHDGHQEAVMWFSAVNELFQFLFGAGAMLLRLHSAARARRLPLELAALGLFVLALLSKESACILFPLLWLAAPEENWREKAKRLWPYALLSLLAVASIAATRSVSPRFTDGSFVLSAPFWRTLPFNLARLLWVWGWAAGVALLAFRAQRSARSAGLALAWAAIALIPYSFLTYSARIPSRQLYLPSAGLAILVGIAAAWLWERLPNRRALLCVALAAILLQNWGVLWLRKYRQFELRAEPTDQLIALAQRTPGPIWVQCFPTLQVIAQGAVYVAAGRPFSDLVWSREEAIRRGVETVFCYQRR